MNRAEARRLLAAWRPDSPVAADPEFTAALDFARRDPEFSAWLESHARFQAGTSAALRSIPVPPGLADQILAARKTARPSFRPAYLGARGFGLAATAALLFLAVVSIFWQRPPANADFATFRNRAVRAVQREYRMDIVTNRIEVIREFLAEHQAPADFVLPPRLAAEPAVGGGLLSWQGAAVSMICLGGGKQGMLYLFVLPTERAGEKTPTAPEEARIGRLPTISWSAGGRTYLLAADRLGREELKSFL